MAALLIPRPAALTGAAPVKILWWEERSQGPVWDDFSTMLFFELSLCVLLACLRTKNAVLARYFPESFEGESCPVLCPFSTARNG
ncbi:hypothetical protein B0H11DRAFT_2276518, partial [Mycena galericulata]